MSYHWAARSCKGLWRKDTKTLLHTFWMVLYLTQNVSLDFSAPFRAFRQNPTAPRVHSTGQFAWTTWILPHWCHQRHHLLVSHHYRSDLCWGNCHNGGANTEAENRLQQEEGLRENSPLQSSCAVRISVVSAIKVKSKKENCLQPRWGMEMPHVLLRRALELRALGLDWKLEKLHTCLASGNLWGFSCSGFLLFLPLWISPQYPCWGWHSMKA